MQELWPLSSLDLTTVKYLPRLLHIFDFGIVDVFFEQSDLAGCGAVQSLGEWEFAE